MAKGTMKARTQEKNKERERGRQRTISKHKRKIKRNRSERKEQRKNARIIAFIVITQERRNETTIGKTYLRVRILEAKQSERNANRQHHLSNFKDS